MKRVLIGLVACLFASPVLAQSSSAIQNPGLLANVANTFTQPQIINLNSAAAPSLITDTALGIFAADTKIGRVQIGSFANFSAVTCVRWDGTLASPTQVLSGDQVCGINGYAGTGVGSAVVGPIYSYRGYAAENIDATHNGSKACIATTPTASTTLADNLCVLNDGAVTITKSLAIGGATIGTDALGVTGTTSLSDTLKLVTGKAIAWNGDTGLSRDSAGIVDVGNGTAGNTSGTVKANQFIAGNSLIVGGNQGVIAGLNSGQIKISDNAGTGFSLVQFGGATTLNNISFPSTATFQHGAADVDTAPVAQTIRSQGALAGGTSNVAGANLTVIVSPGKGTGAGGSFIVQTAPAGSTGTVVNAPVTALTIDSTGLISTGAGGNSIPQFVFTPNSGSNTSFGSANSGSELIVFSAGTQIHGITASAIVEASGGGMRWTNSSSNVTTTQDLALQRIAAANLRLGFGNNATPVANVLTIGESSRPATDTNVGGANGTVQSGNGTGTGAVSHFLIQTPVVAGSGSGAQTQTTQVDISSAGVALSNALLFTDNTYDIGANGASRPKKIWTASDINSGGAVAAAASSQIYFTGRSSITSASDGNMAFRNNANSADANITAANVTASGTLKTTAGRVVAVRVITAAGAVTVTTADYVVAVNKTVGAATTVNLPAGVDGQELIVKDAKGDAAANNITVTPAAGTIDGAATFVINTNRGSVTLVYSSAAGEWEVI